MRSKNPLILTDQSETSVPRIVLLLASMIGICLTRITVFIRLVDESHRIRWAGSSARNMSACRLAYLFVFFFVVAVSAVVHRRRSKQQQQQHVAGSDQRTRRFGNVQQRPATRSHRRRVSRTRPGFRGAAFDHRWGLLDIFRIYIDIFSWYISSLFHSTVHSIRWSIVARWFISKNQYLHQPNKENK